MPSLQLAAQVVSSLQCTLFILLIRPSGFENSRNPSFVNYYMYTDAWTKQKSSSLSGCVATVAFVLLLHGVDVTNIVYGIDLLPPIAYLYTDHISRESPFV